MPSIRNDEGHYGARLFLIASLCLLALGVTATIVARRPEPEPATTPSRPDQPAPASVEDNQVRVENARPGSPSWQYPLASAGAIEGYSSVTSVRPGAMLRLHVSTRPAERYRVEVYRLGWYGGAGARLVLCAPECTADEPG